MVYKKKNPFRYCIAILKAKYKWTYIFFWGGGEVRLLTNPIETNFTRRLLMFLKEASIDFSLHILEVAWRRSFQIAIDPFAFGIKGEL